MLVRRQSEAAVTEWHSLRTHILMDAGELGSRNMSAILIEVPPGASERLRSHEEAEHVYVIVRGSGTLSAAGDTEELGQGDLALIPPATDHSISNEGDEPFTCISVLSPAISVDELFDRQLAGNTAAGYDEDGEY
ncbi:MAG TPA: cupin domain-containing protein [Solirubrobacterales bacterium]|nr:cupin domain-containing protein [Solirubrobacterales bacterium]